MEGRSRFKRLLALLNLLEQGQYNCDQLVQLGGVSKRTLYRDLQLLKDCQVPVVFDRRSRVYRLESFYQGPIPRFSADEIRALFESAKHLDEPSGTVVRQALAKLRASLPDDLKRIADNNGH